MNNDNQNITSEEAKKERLRAYKREWARKKYQNNREQILAKITAYNKAHPENVNKATKKYDESHKEQHLELSRQWRENTREKYNSTCYERHRERLQTDPAYKEKLKEYSRQSRIIKELKNIEKIVEYNNIECNSGD